MSPPPRTEKATPPRPQSTALVVDDDVSVVLLLRKLLERRGVRVLGAYDGNEGLAALAAQQVDLLVVDHQLPQHDGLQLVEAARKRDPSVAVVMVTAIPSWRVDRVGLDGFLDKPFKSLREVEVCLGNALEARHHRALRAELDADVELLERPAK